MWMKLIFLLVTTVCTSAGFVQKRSSVLTDESKRILDIFDFSNFDKQEALGYLERQRFENLIRGKRSKWNLKQNLIGPELSSGGTGEYSKREFSENPLTDDEKIKLNTRRDLQLNEEEYLEPCQVCPAKRVIRGTRDVKQSEDTKDSEEKDVGEHKDESFKSVAADDKNNEQKDERRKRKKKRHHWSKWSEWSPCSVTCGKGRKIRFRRCIAKSCASGEIEMGEKTCQLPACSVFDKLFSFLI